MTETIHMPKFDLMAPDAFRLLVAMLTNHERNKWARAGYPGLKNRDAMVIAELFPQTVMRRSGWVSIVDLRQWDED